MFGDVSYACNTYDGVDIDVDVGDCGVDMGVLVGGTRGDERMYEGAGILCSGHWALRAGARRLAAQLAIEVWSAPRSAPVLARVKASAGSKRLHMEW